MTEKKTSQYSLDCASFNMTTLEHKVGRIKQVWADCQFFPFKPGVVETILLTSPFIERAVSPVRNNDTIVSDRRKTAIPPTDLLYEVINRCYEHCSVIIATNHTFKGWNHFFPMPPVS
jgi:hypothetical protein